MVIILSELRWISRASSARRKRGGRGVVAGVRCGVRSALPTQALSAPPLIAVFVAAQPISLTPTSFDPFHPSPFASPRIPMFMRKPVTSKFSFVSSTTVFPTRLFSHPLLITLFFRSRGCQRLRPTTCLKLPNGIVNCFYFHRPGYFQHYFFLASLFD